MPFCVHSSKPQNYQKVKGEDDIKTKYKLSESFEFCKSQLMMHYEVEKENFIITQKVFGYLN
jgi:hypothetical protein